MEPFFELKLELFKVLDLNLLIYRFTSDWEPGFMGYVELEFGEVELE